MDEIEIRAKAAEIAANYSGRLMAAHVIGKYDITEFNILGFAPDVEEYIKSGKLPEPIKVERTKRFKYE